MGSKRTALEKINTRVAQFNAIASNHMRFLVIAENNLTVEHRDGGPPSMHRWVVREGSRILATANTLGEAVDQACEALGK